MLLMAIILLAGISNSILGFYVLAGNWKKPLNISFALLGISLGSWSFFNLLFQFTFNENFLKATYITGLLIPPITLIWINYLIKEKIKKSVWFLFFTEVLLSLVLIGFLFASDLMISGNFGTADFKIILGPLSNVLFGYMLIILSVLIFYIFKFYLTSVGRKKLQMKIVLFGIFGFVFVVSLVSFILPILGYMQFSNLDSPSSLIFVGFSAYAIVRHRLMDIKTVVARSLAYIILIATLAAFYAGSVVGLERLFFPNEISSFNLTLGAMRTVIAVIMVFLFQPLRLWITKATDSIFFKNQYDPQQLLDQLSHTIGSTIVLIEMLYKVNDLLIHNMKLSRSAFVLFKNEDQEYTSQAIGYKGWPPVDVPDFVKMVKKGMLVYDELEENSTYKKLMRKHDASIIVPIIVDNELIGVYLAGEKSSGDMFSQQDIKIFEILAPEIAVAIENAKSYEEISKFNVTLRQEVKRATKHLKEKNDQLRELDKAKDEFISMASHQLRTPLTAIKGYLSMLLEGDAGEIKVSQYDFINEAYSAAGRMVGLINDLLNVSRMETGRFFLEPKEVDLERIIGEEVKQLENHAREKGLKIKIDIKGKVPHIFADETKIRQVVMNFIDNAVYYTQNGTVTVKLHKDKDNVIFEVVDTGIGVPKEQQAHLFEKFFRADNARQTRPDGTGLGIYLAKRVTEDHGGKVIFHSEEGKGSTFGFSFPLKAAKLAAKPNALEGGALHPTAPSLTSASTMLSSSPDKSTETVTPAPIATHPEG